MSKCCFDIRTESEYQVLKCYFDIAESLLRLTIFLRYYSTRAVLTFELSPNIKFCMPKCYFDIRAESFFDIIQLGVTYPLVTTSPYLTLSGTGI